MTKIVVQIIITIISFINVILATKQKSLKWILTILSSTISIFLYIKAGLIIKSITTFIFIINAFYGFYNWYFCRTKNHQYLKITNLNTWNLLNYTLIFFILSILLGTIEYYFSKDYISYLEAFAIFSILAHFLMAKKKIETWFFWIFLDILFAFICFKKSLYIFAFKYSIYVLLATYGYFIWKKKLLNLDKNQNNKTKI